MVLHRFLVLFDLDSLPLEISLTFKKKHYECGGNPFLIS